MIRIMHICLRKKKFDLWSPGAVFMPEITTNIYLLLSLSFSFFFYLFLFPSLSASLFLSLSLSFSISLLLSLPLFFSFFPSISLSLYLSLSLKLSILKSILFLFRMMNTVLNLCERSYSINTILDAIQVK